MEDMRYDQTFESAVALLRSRARVARPKATPQSILPQANLPGGSPTFKGKPPIEGMKGWLQKLGHDDDKIDSLRIIHVAGTKGKGSTCALVEHLLRAHGQRTGFPKSTGLYTSPHLLAINERIRIDFKPLSESLFARYFFEVFEGMNLQRLDSKHGPRYLQLLALLSYHTFLREGVDLAVYETHHGGEYDPTNVVRSPTITAITPIGIDHIHQLGPTVENIAWHKSGIFKQNALAFSAKQEPDVAAVLEERAEAQGNELEIVDEVCIVGAASTWPRLQQQNLALATRIAQAWLKKVRGSLTVLQEIDIEEAARSFSWPGRFQIINDRQTTWYLDGAHNELSIVEALKWFETTASKSNQTTMAPQGTIIFAQNSDQRDGDGVLRRLAEQCKSVQSIIFTVYDEGMAPSSTLSDAEVMDRYSNIWREIVPGGSLRTVPSVAEAMELAKKDGNSVLITGSLYLIASALRVLQESKLQ